MRDDNCCATSRNIGLAITGASGAQYGLRLLACLVNAGIDVDLMISRAAEVVINTETDCQLPSIESEQSSYLAQRLNIDGERVRLYGKEDWFSPVASGSSAPRSLVICPASGGTLSAIACGASNNLIERAADVALKERRQLILVPRETPYSEIHLENMLKLTRMGAVILPASPGFYWQPKGIDDLVDFVVARVLDQLGVGHRLQKQWGEDDV